MTFSASIAASPLRQQQLAVLEELHRKLIGAIQSQPALTEAYHKASEQIQTNTPKRPRPPLEPPPAKRPRTAAGAAGSMGAQRADLASYTQAPEVTVFAPGPASASSSSSSSSAQAAATNNPRISPSPAAVAAAAAAASAIALSSPPPVDPRAQQIAAVLAAQVAQQARDLEEAQKQRAEDAAKISDLQTKVDFSEATRAKTFRAIKKSTEEIRTQRSTIRSQAEKITGLEDRLAKSLKRQIDLSHAIAEAEETAAKAAALIEEQQEELNSARAKIAALMPAAALSANGAGLYAQAAPRQPDASSETPKATR